MPHRLPHGGRSNPALTFQPKSNASAVNGWICQCPIRCPTRSALNPCHHTLRDLFQTDPEQRCSYSSRTIPNIVCQHFCVCTFQLPREWCQTLPEDCSRCPLLLQPRLVAIHDHSPIPGVVSHIQETSCRTKLR